MIRLALICATGIALAACAAPTKINRPAPEGLLAVMGQGLDFSLDAPPEDWIIATDEANVGPTPQATPLSTAIIDGVPALEMRSGPVRSLAVRRVDAMLLATPYLSWAWHLSDHGKGIHPVRLVVGFKGGAPEAGQVEIMGGGGGGLPEHDRALSLVWGDTALRRGTLSLPPADRPLQAPLYTVRGGRENTRTWWKDTVDLSDLYAKAWPEDTRRIARITFIGVAAAPRVPAVRGRVSGILLSH